jgi:hypothetical protein
MRPFCALRHQVTPLAGGAASAVRGRPPQRPPSAGVAPVSVSLGPPAPPCTMAFTCTPAANVTTLWAAARCSLAARSAGASEVGRRAGQGRAGGWSDGDRGASSGYSDRGNNCSPATRDLPAPPIGISPGPRNAVTVSVPYRTGVAPLTSITDGGPASNARTLFRKRNSSLASHAAVALPPPGKGRRPPGPRERACSSDTMPCAAR